MRHSRCDGAGYNATFGFVGALASTLILDAAGTPGWLETPGMANPASSKQRTWRKTVTACAV